MNRTIHIEIVCQKIMDCTIYVIITYSLWQEAYSPGEHGRGSGGERAIAPGNKKQKYILLKGLEESIVVRENIHYMLPVPILIRRL